MRLNAFLAIFFLAGCLTFVLPAAGRAQTAPQAPAGTVPVTPPGVSLPASLSPPAALADAPAETIVSGRRSVVVQNDVVHLSDIFNGVAASRDKPVLHAPAPGEDIVLDRNTLQRLARENGLNWIPLSGDDKVTLARSGNTVSSQDILAAVAESLVPLGLPPSAELETGSPLPKVIISSGSKPEIIVSDARYSARDGQFSCQVEVHSGTVIPTRLGVSGHVFETVDIPVLSRAMARGQIITPTDISWEKYRIASLPQDIATTFDQLSGMAPKRTMRTGEPVSLRDIERPAVIEKGKAVTMILNTPFIQLTAQGKALESGAAGELIKVQNSRSGKTVNATVINSHTVSVDSAQSGYAR